MKCYLGFLDKEQWHGRVSTLATEEVWTGIGHSIHSMEQETTNASYGVRGGNYFRGSHAELPQAPAGYSSR